MGWLRRQVMAVRDSRAHGRYPDAMAGYLLAVAGTLAIAALRAAADPLLGGTSAYLPFCLSILLAAIASGRNAGLLATVLGALLATWLFAEPRSQLAGLDASNGVRLAVFLAVGVLTSLLAGRWRVLRAEAQRRADELIQSEARFRGTFQNAAVGITHTDIDGRILRVNQKLCDILGYSREELERISFRDLTHPEDMASDWERYTRLVRGELSSYSVQKRYLRKDGTAAWVEISRSPQRDEAGRPLYSINIVQDITARRQAEEASSAAQAEAQRERRRLAAVLDALPVSVFIADAEGRLVATNPTAQRLWGEAALSQHPGQYGADYKAWWPDGRPVQAHEWGLARALRDGETVLAEEMQIEARDGQRRTILNYALPIRDQDGRITGGVAVNVDITDRKRDEEALRQSEQRARATFDNAGVGIVEVEADDRFVAVNDRVCQMLGYTRQELLSMNVHELTHPEDRALSDRLNAEIHQGVRDRAVYEKRYLTRDGSPLWVHVTVSAVRDAAGRWLRSITTVEDIDERKRAAREVERRGRSLKLLSETATQLLRVQRLPDLLRPTFEAAAAQVGAEVFFNFLVTEDGGGGQRLRLNVCGGVDEKTCRSLQYLQFGQAICGAVAQRQERFVLEDVQNSTDPAAESVRSLGVSAYACHPLMTDRLLGTLSFGSRSRTRFGEDELELMRALADQIALAVERQALTDELERRATEAAEANRAKDHFLAVLSHELRTPLTAVLPALGLLEEIVVPAEGREYLEMARRNVEMETRLIDDLLDVTRIERGKIELHRQPVDLCALVRQAAEVSYADIEARRLHFSLETDGCPHPVHADPARLQQVFWNLIKNAVKFTPPDGRIRVRCYRNDAQAVVEVSDSGVGIEPQALSRIFKAFEQADRATTRQFGGLGLGLAISKALVDLHGGTIRARSDGKGKGATFIVELPVASGQLPETPSAGQPSAGADSRQAAAATGPLRILLVEDHADTARILRRLLRAAGHQVQHAGDVSAALELAAAQPFDLIISDLGLPDGSGHELMRQLRGNGQAPPPPHAIALSGYGTAADVLQSREAGFDEHLVKPVNLGELHEAIRRVAGSSSPSGSAPAK